MAKLNIDLTSLIITREKKLNFWKERFLSAMFQASLIIVAIQLVLIAALWRFIPPQVPLFYCLPWGQEQLADKIWLFLIPISLLFLSAVNLYTAMILFIKEKLLTKIIAVTNFVIIILFTITVLEIIYITVF